jgi:hypothetical protein
VKKSGLHTGLGEKSPQRLKPHIDFAGFCGLAEAMPLLQDPFADSFFTKLSSRALVTNPLGLIFLQPVKSCPDTNDL